MKKLYFVLLIGIFLSSPGILSAQVKQNYGSVKVLKGQTRLNLKYDFTELMVGRPISVITDHKSWIRSEYDYIRTNKEALNKKNPGEGNRWAFNWTEDRVSRFQPNFEKAFNKITERYKLLAKEYSLDAKYTLVIHTTYIEVLLNEYDPPRTNAIITLEITLKETSNPSNILATIEMKNIRGEGLWGYDYEQGERIESCYTEAGKQLGNFIAKNGLK